jgi:hypothetical protein
MPKHAESTKPAARASGTETRYVTETARHGAGPPAHVLTISIPMDEAIDVAVFPVKMAGRVLSSNGGLPLYAGLGVLAAAQVIEWPVAALAGMGYAVLSRWGPLRPAAHTPPGADGKASGSETGRSNGSATASANRNTNAGPTRNTNASATRKTNASATRKTNAGATRKTNAGATRKTNAGATRKTNAGATRKTASATAGTSRKASGATAG